ncbi:hypothetical protein HYH02_005264 [Chlamydomonas schloesseri]|uniref:Uncharacterized protein n=1 Tax=Chlamydomonas schloesseri TaxID=2026947 RepID=A0A836B7H6_9CHLO|nr:hypothetical protein HYH02_005264 [Chlamydomonas schloesseri]|eukprot:KAG2449738.1 hypothetical protein HYH02_005264 [Chlamydomonas schloesseri]
MKPRRSAAAARRDSFDGEDVDEECGVASGAAFDAAQGGEALQAVDDAADDAACGTRDADVAASAGAAATAEELNTSCLPGGIAKLMNADSDVPAPAAAGTVIAGVGAGGSYAQHAPSRDLPQRYLVNGIAAAAAPNVGASSTPTPVGTSELQQRWMQPDPVHSGLHGCESYTPHAANGGVAGANAVSAMGQWDSSYSLNTINQQQPCTSSFAHEAGAGASGVSAFPADGCAQRGSQVAAGLKRGFDESGCCGAEAASGPAMQRMRGNNVPGADLVGAASSSNTGSAASAAWMRRADRELNDLMRDMGMVVEDGCCGMAAGAGAARASMRSLAPLRLPDPRPQRDMSSLLLLLRGQADQKASTLVEQKLQQHVPRQVPSHWQELQQHVHMQVQTMPCAPGSGGWQLQRGAPVGGYEIEALDSVPLEALL